MLTATCHPATGNGHDLLAHGPLLGLLLKPDPLVDLALEFEQARPDRDKVQFTCLPVFDDGIVLSEPVDKARLPVGRHIQAKRNFAYHG